MDCFPLLDAASRGDSLTVKRMLDEHPARIRFRDPLGMTPLHRAAPGGQSRIAALLLARGTELAQLPLHTGMPVDTRDRYGWTPLHLAADRYKAEVAEVLLRAGADPNALTLNGRSAWQLAWGREAGPVHEPLRRHGGHPPR